MLLFWPAVGALIGVVAAQRRGFSVVAGVFGGLVLGPLAVFMFLVSGVTAGDRHRKCPHCAEWVKAEANVCKHCGREIAAASATQSRPPKRSAATVLIVFVVGAVLVLAIVSTLTDTRSGQPHESAPDRIKNATEDHRATLLQGIVTSSGSTCREVTRQFFQGTLRTGAAVWNVTCFGGTNFVVTIKDDTRGTTRVLDCIDYQSLTDMPCFKALR